MKKKYKKPTITEKKLVINYFYTRRQQSQFGFDNIGVILAMTVNN